MLVILGVWRHVCRRFPLAYDPLYWGAVFPLGMYTVSTFRLAGVFDAPVLLGLSRMFPYIAITPWFLTVVGMLLDLARRLKYSAAP
jgi:tellurite resistance protein TehA-like permease